MKKLLLIIVTSFSVTGCMQYQQSTEIHPNSLQGRVNRMSKDCDYIVGMTKKQCIVHLGFPTSIKEFDDITVFDYFYDHNGYGHDHFTVTFEKDTAVDWKVDARGW